MQQSGEWQDAASLWKYILTQPDVDFWDRIAHARAVLNSGRIAEAATLISALPDTNAAATVMLQASLEEKRSNHEKARELYGEALKSGASPYWSLFGQARASFWLGEIGKARELMDRALTYSERESYGADFVATLDAADSKAAPGTLTKFAAKTNPRLAKVSFDDILSEVLLRVRADETIANSEQRVALGLELQERLSERLEVHLNRFSVTSLQERFYRFYKGIEPKPKIRRASILDLGCGSHNPLGFLFIFIMLGARLAIGVDLDKVQNAARAFRAMARSAKILKNDPSRIIGDYPITREEIKRNLAKFNLKALGAGDEKGLDQSRLKVVHEPASRLSLESSSIDLVISNSFLEHVDDLEPVLKETARVTLSGGRGIHSIDCIDHWSYADPAHHPFQFLSEPRAGMVHDSNRIRFFEFPDLFRKYGFEIEQMIEDRKISIDEASHQSFASPWREMPRELLEVSGGIIVVRRL